MQSIAQYWQRIQHTLFPLLEETVGELTAGLKEVAAVLEVVRIEEYVAAPERSWPGRPEADRRAIARAFVAKAVLKHADTRCLLEELRRSPGLRRICGWEKPKELPSEATFSRAFAAFAKGGLPQRVHEALIRAHEGERLVGHISRDSTAIEGREKAAEKTKEAKETRKKRKRGRPRKGEQPEEKDPTRLQRQASGKMSVEEMLAELPKGCDWGCKKNSKGKMEVWKGYKLHIDWADGGIPVSAVLTSASVHDSQAALPLMELTADRVTSLYDLMDAAYDAAEIRRRSGQLGHVPIIDVNGRRGESLPMEPARAQRYKERSTAERGNARLKDEFGGRTVRVKGPVKVYAHLMFGVLALAADQLLRLVM